MCLLKATSAASKIHVIEPTWESMEYILDHLKEQDKFKTEQDLLHCGKTRKDLLNLWMNKSEAKWMFMHGNQILFACGITKLDDGSGYALWWEPTELCAMLKKSYCRASLKAVQLLKEHGGTVWTCTPLWYTQNIRATEKLGFEKVGEFLLYGEEYMLFKMEN